MTEIGEFVYFVDPEGNFLPRAGGDLQGLPPSLLDCMSNESLKDLWRGVVKKVSQVGRISLVSRCDSPGVRRRMTIELDRIAEGKIRITSRVLESEPRDESLARKIEGRRALLTICSWCNKVRTTDGWVEVEVAIEEETYLSASDGGTHGVCADCKQALKDAIEGDAQ